VIKKITNRWKPPTQRIAGDSHIKQIPAITEAEISKVRVSLQNLAIARATLARSKTPIKMVKMSNMLSSGLCFLRPGDFKVACHPKPACCLPRSPPTWEMNRSRSPKSNQLSQQAASCEFFTPNELCEVSAYCRRSFSSNNAKVLSRSISPQRSILPFVPLNW
jgi:hypothetical protein